MLPYSLGKTLIIANPTAHSGRGEGAAIFAMRFFSSFTSTTSTCEVRLTEYGGDATRMAAMASDYQTVLALGGDGVIHEIINGLMTIDPAQRPRLGVIPMGSGNDFARTLGMKKNDPEAAIEQLLQGEQRTIDLGKVNDTYFMQTLSFGLDAAIALDTTDRRARSTRVGGSLLFVTSGLKLITTAMNGWPYRAQVDGEEFEDTEIVFAVQNGPTYGGGFRICPRAVPNDGMLDLCYSHDRTNLAHSLALFGLIRFGRHQRSKVLTLKQVRHVEVEFLNGEQAPCQVDGEVLLAERYVIDVVPSALSVIAAPGCGW
ncbi:MAG: diacylglycerol kinase family lipid kinase [Coriobacteriales bacterium]|nr:diacylglycerol kinase family lipid kinase [Coriobacteriales bacterium]